MKKEIKKLLKDYDENMGNNRRGGTILKKISNLLYGHKDNKINNISGIFAYFRDNGQKAYDLSIRMEIDTLKKYKW